MPSIVRSLATGVLLLAGQATAHMVMSHPIPFGTPDTSPLKNAKPGTDASDYPCKKQRADVYEITTMNNMAVNTPIALSFNGSASHAGGTCQLSVSLDKEPTASSVFKVIKVFEGGCPSDASGGDLIKDFAFQIPEGFPNGQATFAWLWYNRLGGTREVYMNCAPITVTGGSENKDVFNSLPNQYLINLPTSECQGVDSTDLVIPYPGQYIEKGQDNVIPKAAVGPSCAASAAAQTMGLSGYQTASAGKNSTPTAYSTVSKSETSSALAGYGSGAPIIVTTSTAAPAYSTPLVTSNPTDAPTSYPTLTVSSSAGIYGPGTAAGTGPAPAATGSLSTDTTCPTNGAVVCNGASQFGLCNNGNVVWQAVAAGTTCSNGQIQKRSAFRHAHVRRHAQKGDINRA